MKNMKYFLVLICLLILVISLSPAVLVCGNEVENVDDANDSLADTKYMRVQQTVVESQLTTFADNALPNTIEETPLSAGLSIKTQLSNEETDSKLINSLNSSPPILTSDGGGLNSSVHEGHAPGHHSQPLLTPLIGPTEISPSHTFNHWWVLDYWDTSSGGNLPSFMSGEFIAVDNTIEGLQAGWELITPWFDAVLYLPLNVAYGTSSTNCVWFQFDIQFVQPGLGWPFPNAVTWYIWDIRGPGTNIPGDYHSTPIGIDYVVGHEYWFALMTSGSSTVTFYILDETSGASWSKSDWKWSVPSTNMLAEEGMFSPASAIEGYTTGASLSNVPFFQTRVGEGVTVNRHYSVGPVPSGITTDRIAVGTYDLWYWMMLTPSSLPIPSISSVDYPSGIGVGQSATIDATVINNGGTASWQTISISFPSDESVSSVSIVQTDLSSSAIHGEGDTVGAAYSTTTTTLQNYLVEGSSSWPSGVSHHLKISVTPDGTGSFQFYVKSVAAASNWACNWDPKTGEKDRQLEFVKTYTIAVGVNPSSISVNVNPDSIFLGGGTTISGSITSSTPGDKTGTVYLQYSTNNVNWNDIGSTTSSSSGAYSHWWEPSTTGTFYVRSYWNGNSQYGGATSSSIYPFTVKTPGGNLDDHCMCKGVQSEYPWDPIERTNVFYTDDPKAHSWLKFVDIYDGPHYVHWDWYDPDGVHWTWDSTIPAPPPGEYWVWYKKSSNLGPLHFADSKLGRGFTTKVYYDDNLVVTETWTVVKHDSSITVSLSSNSITYGQSVTIDSQLSPSFSDGTTTLQYSTDEVNWNNIATGTPSNGHYSSSWKPPAVGTYYVRAKWSGNLNYYGSTSSTKTLTVDKATTTLTTTLSSSSMTYGASVKITASMSPQLQGKTVTIQYSLDNSNWYDLSSGTTNAAGEYAYSWTPAAGSYYIRSTWSGDANYYGATSTSQTLIVNKAPTSTSCSLSSNSIKYGQSVDVTGTVSVPVNTGTMTLEYSVDESTWYPISAGTPSSGSYSCAWIPPSDGTFYVRAEWSGDLNYLGSTSSSQTLTVEPPAYDVTINAHCNSEAVGISVSFTWDGTPYTTPKSFTDQTGSHEVIIDERDESGHPFVKWLKDGIETTDRIITVSSGGNYIAIYEAISISAFTTCDEDGNAKTTFQRTETVYVCFTATYPDSSTVKTGSASVKIQSPEWIDRATLTATYDASKGKWFTAVGYRIPKDEISILSGWRALFPANALDDVRGKKGPFPQIPFGFAVDKADLDILITDGMMPGQAYQRTLTTATVKFKITYPDGSYFAASDLGQVTVTIADGINNYTLKLSATDYDNVTKKWSASWTIPKDTALSTGYRFKIKANDVFDSVSPDPNRGPPVNISDANAFSIVKADLAVAIVNQPAASYSRGQNATFDIRIEYPDSTNFTVADIGTTGSIEAEIYFNETLIATIKIDPTNASTYWRDSFNGFTICWNIPPDAPLTTPTAKYKFTIEQDRIRDTVTPPNTGPASPLSPDSFDVIEVQPPVISVEDQPYASYVLVNITVWGDQDYINASIQADFVWNDTLIGRVSNLTDLYMGSNAFNLTWDSLDAPMRVMGENVTVTITIKSSLGETLFFGETTFVLTQPNKELLWDRLTELIQAWPTASSEERNEIWEKIVKIVTLYPTAP